MLSKKAVAEEERQRAQSDTVAAAASAQEARFELARRLTEASGKRALCWSWGRGWGGCAGVKAALHVRAHPCACVQPFAAWRSQVVKEPLQLQWQRPWSMLDALDAGCWVPQVEARKRHEYLEAAVSVLDGHLRYFKAGFEALKKLEPFMHQARSLPKRSL
jgi:hypothetical protein